MLEVMKKAAEAAGGVTKLANRLGVKRQAFYMWSRVPAERVLSIEAATGGAVTRHELRPDIYPPGDSPLGPATAAARASTPPDGDAAGPESKPAAA